MLLEFIGIALSNLLFLILHVTGAGTFPRPLTAKEERDYLQKMKDGDANARNQLIEHNLRLVAHIIKNNYSNQNDQEDLISIGTIGLIKAVDTLTVIREFAYPAMRHAALKMKYSCFLEAAKRAHKILVLMKRLILIKMETL